jgi:DNA-binding NarL/FixJ family response regulator
MKRIRYAIGDTYLTPCEAEYVGLIVQGYSHPQISEKLGKEVKTVDTTRDNVFGKLGIDNRAALVIKAIRAGFSEDGNHDLKEYTGKD